MTTAPPTKLLRESQTATAAQVAPRATARRRQRRRYRRRRSWHQDNRACLSTAGGLRPLAEALQRRGGQASREGAAPPAPLAADQWRSAQRRQPRPSGVHRLRGVGRRRQGRRDQAARRAARPPTRARRPVRRAHARRAAPSLPVAVLAAAARVGRHDHLRPQLVRACARRAGREPRHRGAVAPGLPGDHRLRALPGRRGNGRHQALDAHVARGAAAPVHTAPGRSAQGVEADRRGLAQPGEAAAVRRRGVGHAALDERPVGALGRDLVGEQAQRAGRGDRDGDPAHGGGDGALGRPGAAR